jgi:hypothetical protein
MQGDTEARAITEPCYLPLDGSIEFEEKINWLDRRRPKAMAFLRRIGCKGLQLRSVGSGCIKFVPITEDNTPITFDEAHTLGMTEEEDRQFDVALEPESGWLLIVERWRFRMWRDEASTTVFCRWVSEKN